MLHSNLTFLFTSKINFDPSDFSVGVIVNIIKDSIIVIVKWQIPNLIEYCISSSIILCCTSLDNATRNSWWVFDCFLFIIQSFQLFPSVVFLLKNLTRPLQNFTLEVIYGTLVNNFFVESEKSCFLCRKNSNYLFGFLDIKLSKMSQENVRP